MAERVRFELTVPFGTTVFKTAAIGHSATSPIVCKIRPECVSGHFGKFLVDIL
jgi:hypothetical protein